jgi:hypothetical protein
VTSWLDNLFGGGDKPAQPAQQQRQDSGGSGSPAR